MAQCSPYSPSRVKILLKRYLNMDIEGCLDTLLDWDVAGNPESFPAWYHECRALLTFARQPYVNERQEKALDWNLRRRTPEEMLRDVGYLTPSGRETFTQEEIAEIFAVSADTIHADIRNALRSIAERMNAGEPVREFP